MEFHPLDGGDDADPRKENGGRAPIPPLRTAAQVERTLELMHDRCIARNLRAAGLGGLDSSDEQVYGLLDANARMLTGETLLQYTIEHTEAQEKLVRAVMGEGLVATVVAQMNQVTILLNEGADPNTRDEEGKTPLMHLVVLGADKVSKALLACEATNVFVLDNDGNSGLHYAAAFGREKLLKPYFKAIRRSDKDATVAVEVLGIRNNFGETPEELAAKNDHPDCSVIIQQERLRRERLNARRLQNLGQGRLRNSVSRLSRFASLDSLFFGENTDSTSEFPDDQYLVRRDSSRQLNTRAGSEEIQLDFRFSPLRDRTDSDVAPVVRPRSATAVRTAFHQMQSDPSYLIQGNSTGRSQAPPPPNERPRLTDRIRNFLRRKPRYELKLSGSVESMSEQRERMLRGREPDSSASSGGPQDIAFLAQLLQQPRPPRDLRIVSRERDEAPDEPRTAQPSRPMRANPRLLSASRDQLKERGGEMNGTAVAAALPPIRNAQVLLKAKAATGNAV